MGKKRGTYTRKFKIQVIEEVQAGVSIAELSRRYEVSDSLISKWKRQFKSSPKNPFPGQGSRNTEKAKIERIERLIGRQAMEIDFLKNLLKRLKEEGR
jgi:transposase